MIRYFLSATALKLFSASDNTRSLYRALGNAAGGRRRAKRKIPVYYVERAKRLRDLQLSHKILRPGDEVLEVGTGWVHWDALCVRLVEDVKCTLFDVWDNRQLDAFKNVARQFVPIISNGCFNLEDRELGRTRELLFRALRADSFDSLYSALDFRYELQPSGSLSVLEDDHFKLVVSGGALEHVDRDAVPELARGMFRVLKPGGWAVHSIDIQDHLSYYDPSVSRKEYLRFSERTWKAFFENKVQYINRIQRDEWKAIFSSAGFEIVEEEISHVSVPRKIADRYKKTPDLDCGSVKLLLRKN